MNIAPGMPENPALYTGPIDIFDQHQLKTLLKQGFKPTTPDHFQYLQKCEVNPDDIAPEPQEPPPSG